MATKAETVFAVIVAAGGGRRMGGVSKPLIKLGKKTLFEYVLDAFRETEVIGVTVVCSDENEKTLREIASGVGYPKEIVFARGGETRAESVYNGVKACPKCDLICVHDCARPFATAGMIQDVIAAARETGVSTACSPVTDTIKFVDEEHSVIYTPERKYLLAIQTPQCFRRELFLPAYLLGKTKKQEFTDESSLLEHAGNKVAYVRCDESNMKITTRSDMSIARAIRLIREKENGTI